ncbi:cytochrome c1 [Inmirania thermothiophila]|uniref:Ubiquinol-cytochrome c reductase cytochrome c1 subunit n=1 Tax=Inmirania thermothiophila TaxID=1750597 RepID=A0A3N1XSP5_9GAMM|nr:cytochrome c1 [Inmirania thermothiophila]ROR29665.1 ubiquinol-cytochrome c reductase cytochrome c1 subunit [Inmirania thermothiophila]
MRKIVAILLLAWLPGLAAASEGGHLKEVDIDLADKESLRRGARLFVDYCLSCHGASFHRWNRMGKDLGIDEETLKTEYLRGAEKVGQLMAVNVDPKQAAKWFGTTPPDLTLVARSRGVDWLYTYLTSFYADEKRPWGVNNALFKDVAMPWVMADLQGLQRAVFTKNAEGQTVIERLEPGTPGKMSPEEFDRAVRDLVAFMAYLGEPMQLERQRLGFWVLLYLAVLFVLSYLLKKEYWKDVH